MAPTLPDSAPGCNPALPDPQLVGLLGSVDGTYLDEECIDVAPIPGPATLQPGDGGPTVWLEPGIAGD